MRLRYLKTCISLKGQLRGVTTNIRKAPSGLEPQVSSQASPNLTLMLLRD